MPSVYHVTTRAAWDAALTHGAYSGDTLATEGFIHCSTGQQVARTLRRYFAGRTDLVLLTIDVGRLTAPLRYESAHGELFPHLYGALPCTAVTAITLLVTRPDGDFALPELDCGSVA